MILISHRANLNGPDPERDNVPHCITETLILGYDCEIDVWGVGDGKFYLGHDKPLYEVSLTDLQDWGNRVWIHAKNKQALQWLLSFREFNLFSHSSDEFTFTSNGDLWCYPSSTVYKEGVNLMPELNGHTKEKLKGCYGVCSDYITRFK